MREALRSSGRQVLRARAALLALAAVSGLSVASSALGFVFQVILAARFGAGEAIDSYLFAISAPTFLAALGAAALSYTVVPALVRVETDPGLRTELLRRLRRQVGGVAAAFALLGLPATAVQPFLLPSGAELHTIAVLPAMIAIGWAIGGAQLFAALFTIELNAARRPITAALLSLPPNLGAIAVVLLGPRSILSAPAGVLFGSLGAVAIGAALTQSSFRKAQGGDGAAAPRSNMRIDRLAWALLAMSCFSAYAVIDAFWAPRAGGGTLASLGYAQRLIIGIGSLVMAGPSAVLAPRFAAALRDRGVAAFEREVRFTLLVVGAIAVLVAALLAIVAGHLVALAFGRGAFDAADAARVASVLRAMLPGFCAMLVSIVTTRAIYCLEAVERPMAAIGIGWSLLYFAGSGTLLRMGGVGFGISYSLAWVGYMLIAMLILYRYARRAV